MANYATEACFILENWPREAIDCLKLAIRIVEDGGETRDAPLSSLPGPVRSLVEKAVQDYDVLGISVKPNDDNSHLVTSEEGMFASHMISELIYETMKAYGIRQVIVMTWADTCDKHRPDAFGGGAAVIVHGHGPHDGIHTIDAGNWARELKERIINDAKNAPDYTNDEVYSPYRP